MEVVSSPGVLYQTKETAVFCSWCLVLVIVHSLSGIQTA